jgi:hypothetical protein
MITNRYKHIDTELYIDWYHYRYVKTLLWQMIHPQDKKVWDVHVESWSITKVSAASIDYYIVYVAENKNFDTEETKLLKGEETG